MSFNVLTLKDQKNFVEGVEHPPRFDLRWRFDFTNKPTKYGQWSRPAANQSEMAAFVNKDGLVRACIEARNYYTHEMLIIAECDGHEFVNFKWNATRHKMMTSTNLPMLANFHNLMGLKLVCADMEVDVYFNGESEVKPRSEEDKKFHYACFGR